MLSAQDARSAKKEELDRGSRRNTRRVTGTIRTTSAEATAGVMRDGTANEENDERTKERTRRGRRGVIVSVSAIAIVTALLFGPSLPRFRVPCPPIR